MIMNQSLVLEYLDFFSENSFLFGNKISVVLINESNQLLLLFFQRYFFFQVTNNFKGLSFEDACIFLKFRDI